MNTNNIEKLIDQYRDETGINNPYTDYAHGPGWVQCSYTKRFVEWLADKSFSKDNAIELLKEDIECVHMKLDDLRARIRQIL